MECSRQAKGQSPKRRHFAPIDRLRWLDRRGMLLIAPWPIGVSLGMTHDVTAGACATLEGIGWIARSAREGGERVGSDSL